MAAYLETKEGRRIAYMLSAGAGPVVVFLGGFKSDMTGTKAMYLEAWAKRHGRAFLRFDYSGHGVSSGAFTDGSISEWAEDTAAILNMLRGKLILVGSSMGGWMSLLMARQMPERIAGMVTIAAAPDFTEDSMWASFDQGQRDALERDGQIALPSEYGEPYVITKKLIEDGRRNLIFRLPLDLPFPVRFLQGTHDKDVDMSVALRLLDHAQGPDIRLVCLKDADHRFSEPDALQLLEDALSNVIQRLG